MIRKISEQCGYCHRWGCRNPLHWFPNEQILLVAILLGIAAFVWEVLHVVWGVRHG